MAHRWIELEFERTGLPKSGLAGYLGIDNAAVTRIMNGERVLSSDEEGLVRAFFSIVARHDPTRSEEVDRLRRRDAIHRLRSTKIRETASAALASWLIEKALQQETWKDVLDPARETYLSMLRSITQRQSSFRSDQIVAICRLLGISVGELVAGNGVEASNDFTDRCPKDLPRELATAAVKWAERGAVPYQFDRYFNAPSPREGGPRIISVLLQPAEIASDELASYEPYLIPDNSHAPRFEQGQTIYVDKRSVPRKGDCVAVELNSSQTGSTKATLGRFLYASRETVSIRSARNANVELPKSDIIAVRRIAYCKL